MLSFFMSWYGNESACREFIQFISESDFKEKIESKLKNSKFINILQDSTVIKNEYISVLFVFTGTFPFFPFSLIVKCSSLGC